MAKTINKETILYMIKDSRTNKIIDGKVYLDKEMADKEKYEYDMCEHNVYIDTVIMPFVGKHICYLDIYRGFDYDFGGVGMYDVKYISQKLYPSVDVAKQSKEWVKLLNIVEQAPENFNIYHERICSKDTFNEDWIFGDVAEGKFCADFVKLRVIKFNKK